MSKCIVGLFRGMALHSTQFPTQFRLDLAIGLNDSVLQKQSYRATRNNNDEVSREASKRLFILFLVTLASKKIQAIIEEWTFVQS